MWFCCTSLKFGKPGTGGQCFCVPKTLMPRYLRLTSSESCSTSGGSGMLHDADGTTVFNELEDLRLEPTRSFSGENAKTQSGEGDHICNTRSWSSSSCSSSSAISTSCSSRQVNSSATEDVQEKEVVSSLFTSFSSSKNPTPSLESVSTEATVEDSKTDKDAVRNRQHSCRRGRCEVYKVAEVVDVEQAGVLQRENSSVCDRNYYTEGLLSPSRKRRIDLDREVDENIEAAAAASRAEMSASIGRQEDKKLDAVLSINSDDFTSSTASPDETASTLTFLTNPASCNADVFRREYHAVGVVFRVPVLKPWQREKFMTNSRSRNEEICRVTALSTDFNAPSSTAFN
ncbi:unnamed protein product [Amoebophrya sp. A120]|nr:unnamed protein product [Amoebophrya sp. A120]|eukprot:GSA120T00009201001.1